jgi:hypothetical protein
MTTQLMPERLANPPPFAMDLIDADRTVGWIIGDTVGFRGFGDATEAAHAAWIAHRTLARRLARTHGTRPVPIDTEPLALRPHTAGASDVILASDRPIGVLLWPGTRSRSGDTFGFELVVPPPTTELQRRAMAYRLYRTLRKSGVRWAMWRPEAQAPAPPVSELAGAPIVEPVEMVRRPRRSAWPRGTATFRWLRDQLRLTRDAIAGTGSAVRHHRPRTQLEAMSHD